MPRQPTADPAGLLDIAALTLEDLEAVRVLLRGGSVIDWHHLDFQTYEDVDRFLRVNELDPGMEENNNRLEDLRAEAVEYLCDRLDFSIPEAVADELPARDLFLVASRKGRRQVWACVILKVMHIIHHLAGRELSTQLSISLDQTYRAIELKVMQVVEELRAAGYPIVEFEWSRKTPDSLVTKLLAKRTTLAANIYDKLRFRMIVREQSDLVPILAALHRRLVPFNYVIPGESVNHLVSFRQLLETTDSLRTLEQAMHSDLSLEKRQDKNAAAPLNEFSADSYRTISFVADLPLRIDEFVNNPPQGLGNVVFVLTEFQLADQKTNMENEAGDGNHDAYKQRQYESVRRRLMRGRRSRAITRAPRRREGDK